MAFIDDFADEMEDTLVAQPVTLDEFGKTTASGSALNLKCYIEGGSRRVMSKAGKEVTSSVRAIVANSGLTIDGHRYGLPARFPSSPDPNGHEAIDVIKVSDEDGPVYEEVILP